MELDNLHVSGDACVPCGCFNVPFSEYVDNARRVEIWVSHILEDVTNISTTNTYILKTVIFVLSTPLLSAIYPLYHVPDPSFWSAHPTVPP